MRYLRCVRYRDGCSARARIDLDSDTFFVIGEHEAHESTKNQIEISKVVSKFKRRAEFSQGTLREIFDEEANQSEVGGYISFPWIESSMYKRRQMHRPQIPFDAQNALSLLETCDEEFKEYHAFSIEGINENEIAIGFMSLKWRNTFQPGGTDTMLQADATFYVVPEQFYQLLNVFLQYKNYFLPAFHILMTKKTTTLYDQVILKIKEILPFTPTDIMTDYEEALFHSISVNYPNVRAVGCMFHHDQALHKTQIMKNGLSNLYLTNREFRNWAELLLSLPLLRSNKIVDMYHYLKHEKPVLSQLDELYFKFVRDSFCLRSSKESKANRAFSRCSSIRLSLRHLIKISSSFDSLLKRLDVSIVEVK